MSKPGEFDLIRRISKKFKQPALPELGIGDDAAIISPKAGEQLLVSTDLLLEDVHFRLDYTSPHLLGRKALSVNLSDIAAMGAKPRYFFLSLAIPPKLSTAFVDELLNGIAEQAEQHSCILAGGDTCSSQNGLMISITILGMQQPERILKRNTAQVGDEIWVSGTLGDSAAGLYLLENGIRAGDQFLLSRHLDPQPRCQLALMLAEATSAETGENIISSMIDISDGLLADLGHICEQSATGAEIHLNSIPLSSHFCTFADQQQAYPWQMAACGGEDYELCFTAAPKHRDVIMQTGKKAGVLLTVVGKLTNSGLVQAFLPDGSIFEPHKPGFSHF
ncbi:MAG: thiamine-phosphate kinase [Trichlorobacter sp.]|jgi:thiamine-monophosphate kinase|nr:thiamine-phosphate kinase [Trichlorobacter sp.]